MPNDLDQKIRAFEKAHKGEDSSGIRSLAHGASAGGRVGFELLAATGFFALIGYALDAQLGTLPLFTLVLFFIGFATGIYNAWRVVEATNDRVGFRSREKHKAPDKEPLAKP